MMTPAGSTRPVGVLSLLLAFAAVALVFAQPKAPAPRNYKNLPGKGLSLASYTPQLQRTALSVLDTLEDTPAGFGPRCSDRASWAAMVPVNSTAGRSTLNRARAASFPPFDTDAYLAFRRNGSRVGDFMINARISYVAALAMAECVEFRGNFLPDLIDALMQIAQQRSWDNPSHDSGLLHYNGIAYSVQLMSSQYAAELGQIIYALGDVLPYPVQAAVLAALETRIFAPMRAAYNGSTDQINLMWWMVGPTYNNWNAVCLSGITTAALAVLPDKTDRALFIAGDMLRSKFFTSFASDGFGPEGVSYFGYAVMNSIRDREIILQHTRGAVDTFNTRVVARALLFALEFPMTSNVQPCTACLSSNANFGDDDSTFSKPIVQYVGNTLLNQSNALSGTIMGGVAGQTMSWWLTPNRITRVNIPSITTKGIYALRNYYQDSGVLVSRPDTGNTGRGIAMTVKLLGNSYSHSHNDVGSYAVALNSVTLTGDPGSPGGYDASSFSGSRYAQPIYNSYGHPVPRVAGKDQNNIDDQVRRLYRLPKVVSTSFNDDSDSMAMNLTNAYNVSSLRLLMRNATYVRSPVAYVLLQDTVTYTQPALFETALVTLNNCTITLPSTICFSKWPSPDRLCAQITASAPFTLSTELLGVAASRKTFTRVSVKITAPVTQAWIRAVIYDISNPPQMPEY